VRIPLRAIVALVFLTLFAGALGGWLGIVYGERVTHPRNGLDTVIHQELDLTVEQNHRIEALEMQFAARQKILQAEMRTANRELATALDSEHAYGPRAQAAVDRFHHAEEKLQVATIEHVLAMRAVLNADQSRKFDRAIYEALTAGTP
jgi:Spy/CpxP family protein refolding chaperone